jgi:hypothetical protein
MQDLLDDKTVIPGLPFGNLIDYKKDKSTASRITPPNPYDNPRNKSKQYILRHSSLTDVFNDPDKTGQIAKDITRETNTKREAARQFIKDFKEGKREKENARRKTFGEKQLSRTTDKYTRPFSKDHQGGKYSRIKRKRVTRKGMRKTRAKSKKNNKKHYKRR